MTLHTPGNHVWKGDSLRKILRKLVEEKHLAYVNGDLLVGNEPTNTAIALIEKMIPEEKGKWKGGSNQPKTHWKKQGFNECVKKIRERMGIDKEVVTAYENRPK